MQNSSVSLPARSSIYLCLVFGDQTVDWVYLVLMMVVVMQARKEGTNLATSSVEYEWKVVTSRN